MLEIAPLSMDEASSASAGTPVAPRRMEVVMAKDRFILILCAIDFCQSSVSCSDALERIDFMSSFYF